MYSVPDSMYSVQMYSVPCTWFYTMHSGSIPDVRLNQAYGTTDLCAVHLVLCTVYLILCILCRCIVCRAPDSMPCIVCRAPDSIPGARLYQAYGTRDPGLSRRVQPYRFSIAVHLRLNPTAGPTCRPGFSGCLVRPGSIPGVRAGTYTGVRPREIETLSFQMQDKSFVLSRCYAVSAASLFVIKL
jgi:hypothetical protein